MVVVVAAVIILVLAAMAALDRRIWTRSAPYNRAQRRKKRIRKFRKGFQNIEIYSMFKWLSAFHLVGHLTLSDKSGSGGSVNGCRLWAVSKFASNVIGKMRS